MNWLDAIITKLYSSLFLDKPNPVLVIVTYLIMSLIIWYSPSVEGV